MSASIWNPADPTRTDQTIEYVNEAFAPSQWFSVDGSLRNGAISIVTTRVGGFGPYGLTLTEYLIDTELPTGQIDVGSTEWVVTTNLTGGFAYGSWSAARTPNSEIPGQVWTAGGIIGKEINFGNSYVELGLLTDISATRFTAGLILAPDIPPAQDGVTTTTYAGSFALVFAPSIHGHKIWVGALQRQNAIMPGGHSNLYHGGSSVPNEPLSYLTMDGNWTRGINFANAVFSSQAILLGASHSISWGGASMNGTTTTFGVTTGGTGLGALYGNSFAQLCMGWASSGAAPQIGFYGTTPIVKQTGVAVSAAGVHAALVNLGLISA